MDYEALLRKYVAHVVEHEGWDYIEHTPPRDVEFSPDEWAALESIAAGIKVPPPKPIAKPTPLEYHAGDDVWLELPWTTISTHDDGVRLGWNHEHQNQYIFQYHWDTGEPLSLRYGPLAMVAFVCGEGVLTEMPAFEPWRCSVVLDAAILVNDDE